MIASAEMVPFPSFRLWAMALLASSFTSGPATLRAARNLKTNFQLSGLRDRPRYLLEATGFIRLFSEVPQETSA